MASASATSILLVSATPAASRPPCMPVQEDRRRRRRRRTVSCRASAGGNNDGSLLWLPRRDVLAGLGGVAAAGLAAYPDLASIALEANPVDNCRRGDKVTDNLVECSDPNRGFPCPPQVPTPIVVDFEPERAVTRVRRPSHLLSREYQEKYREAVGKMRALPATNPLSFAAQAAVHEAYCDGHYRYDPAEKNRPFDVHFSWIFAPWHRMYIYFYEKALGQLIGDDTFALPYWNWDSPAGMGIPAIFKDSSNPLYDPYRDQTHRDALIDLDYIHSPKDVPPIPFVRTPATAAAYDEAVQKNLRTIYQQQVRGGKGPRAYLGEKLCSEASLRVKEINERSRRRQDGQQIKPNPSASQGTLERMAHTAVHVWAGRPDPKGGCAALTDGAALGHDGKPHCGNDMGFLGTAGRDPLFYSHHANVDRMWHLWSTKLGGAGFDDPEWLDASFVFFDGVESPRPVRIRFRDVLDTRNLGYTYDDEESEKALPWFDSKPTRLSPGGSKGGSSSSRAEAAPEFPLTLRGSDQAVVVPGVAVPVKQAGKDLVLVVEGIEYDPRTANKFDVAINVPEEDALKVGPQCSEYAGSFSAVPSSKADGGTLLGKISLLVDGVLADLGAGGDATVDVVLVPRTAGEVKVYLPPTIQNA